MVDRQKYIKAIYEIWKFKNPDLSSYNFYDQIIKNDSKVKKLGLFVYDYRAEIKPFDRSSINPLGAIVNKKL